MQKSFTADCPFSCSVSACFPGTYGDSCSGPCPNQHYGKNCGLKCNGGPDEECHTLYGCISSTNCVHKSSCAAFFNCMMF